MQAEVEFYTEDVIVEKTKSLHQNSIRAAIAQAMARNGSHNIGSHVLSSLVTKENIMQLSEEMSNLHHPANQYYPVPSLAQNQHVYNVHDCIAYTYSYLKNRMDFLADIIAGPPALESSRLLIQEVIAGFDKNRIFLNRISGISDFKFRFAIKDCRHISPTSPSSSESEFDSTTDIPVAIVNDVLGQHALYIILENIIRNTAKHASIKEHQEIVFTIEISECEEDHSLYECIIYDNCFLTDTCIENLVYNQNSLLNTSILNEHGVLRENNRGLIEMDICAAYLRKINPEDINSSMYHIPLTIKEERIFKEDPAGKRPLILSALRKGNYLAYKIYLPKPKELLIIDQQGEVWKELFYKNGILAQDILNELACNGILCLHSLDEPAICQWKWQPDTSYCQQLLVLLTTANLLKSNYIPQRTITKAELLASYTAYRSIDIRTVDETALLWHLLRQNMGRKFIEEAWRCLVRKKMREKNIAQINPHPNYSHFIAPQRDGYALNVALDNHARNIQTLLTMNDYYEEYNHLTIELIKNRIHPYIDGTLKKDFNFKDLFSFMEGILTNVLIIDERVQKYFYSTIHGIIKKSTGFIAAKSGIYCPPPHVLALSSQSFDTVMRSSLVQYIYKLRKEQAKLKGLDIVVIHLGIIEKILKAEDAQKDGQNIRGFIEDFKQQAVQIFGYAPFIIVTSGRGKPEQLSDDIPFIGYSIVSQFAVENRSKNMLTQALYAARPNT